MDDLISRQAAIEVIDAVMPVDPNKSEYASGIACGAALAMTYIKQLPPAQPEISCSETPNTSDTISRQAAIDVLNVLCQEHRYRIPGKRETYSEYNEAWQDALDRAEGAIGNLPSAQPETNCSEIPNNWIPCIERLPEDEYVLISKKPTKLSGSKWCVTIAIRMADPRSRKVDWRDIGFNVIQDNEVLAWMPLPEVYKERREK